MPGDTVKQRRDHLCCVRAHVIQCLIDHEFLHHQLIARYSLHALRQLIHSGIEVCRGDRLEHEPHISGFLAGDQIAGEQHTFGFFRTKAIDPPGRGRTTPYPCRWVADLRVIRHHHEIAAEGDVGTASDRISVNFGDGGFVTTPKAHEVLGIAIHHVEVCHRIPGSALRVHRRTGITPGLLFRRQDKVIAGTECAAGAGHNKHVHLWIFVGEAYCSCNFAWHSRADGIQAFRTIQGERRDPPGLFIEHMLKTHLMFFGELRI